MTPWVPWAGKGHTDPNSVTAVAAGTEGMYFGTSQPSPSTSVIPTLDSSVITAYKDWAQIDAASEWPITP